jgi:thiol peroxidase
MRERTGLVTLHGGPLTLLGDEIRVGDKAPPFHVVDNSMKPASLSDFAGKTLVILSVPSLDTPVCDMEGRRFNREAAGLGENVAVIAVSMDLPFAQKRWCAAAGVERVHTLSDHREASFGQAYGVLIKELRLLARAVFIVDAEGILRYFQLVPEVGHEPDYDKALEALEKLAKAAV